MEDMKALLKRTRPFEEEDISRGRALLAWTLAVWTFCFVGTFPQFHWAVRLASSIAMGLVTVRIFIFYHDYLHGAIFRKEPWARAFMDVFGILILNPPNVWKRSHNYHHQHNSQMATASIGSFPLMSVEQYRRANWKTRAAYTVARHPLTIIFGYVFIFILGMCLKSFLTDPKRHWDSGVALLVHGLLIAGFAQFGWDVAFLSLILPLAVACGLGGYLFYIQHNFPAMKLRPREEWNFVFASLNSSSYMRGNPLVHWLTGNIGYHHVHHLNARIPFYRLPETMEAVEELQNPGTTSLAPLDVYRCFRLKLWDSEQQAMVDFKGRPVRSPSSMRPAQSIA